VRVQIGTGTIGLATRGRAARSELDTAYDGWGEALAPQAHATSLAERKTLFLPSAGETPRRTHAESRCARTPCRSREGDAQRGSGARDQMCLDAFSACVDAVLFLFLSAISPPAESLSFTALLLSFLMEAACSEA
jgi:hypothetical protein